MSIHGISRGNMGRQDAGIVTASWVYLFHKVNNGDLSIKHFFGGKQKKKKKRGNMNLKTKFQNHYIQ